MSEKELWSGIENHEFGSSESIFAATGKSKKRKGEKNQNEVGKRRFVWPENLHLDFIAAVFDIGLRSVTPKHISALSPQCSGLTTEQIQSHIQKFRLQRNRNIPGYQPYHSQNTSSSSIESCQQGIVKTSFEGNQGENNQKKAYETSLKMIQEKVIEMSKSLEKQSIYLSNMRELVYKQQNLRKKLLEQLPISIDQSLPSISNPFSISNSAIYPSLNHPSCNVSMFTNEIQSGQQDLSPLTANIHKSGVLGFNSNMSSSGILTDSRDNSKSFSINDRQNNIRNHIVPGNFVDLKEISLQQKNSNNNNNNSSSRAEIQIMNDMREQMNLHRKLLMKKEDQLSLHGGKSRANSAEELQSDNPVYLSGKSNIPTSYEQYNSLLPGQYVVNSQQLMEQSVDKYDQNNSGHPSMSASEQVQQDKINHHNYNPSNDFWNNHNFDQQIVAENDLLFEDLFSFLSDQPPSDS